MLASAAIQEAVIDALKNVSRRPIEPALTSDLIGDLGFDSLQVLELIAELEDRLNTSIPTDDLAGIRTVEHVVRRVTSLVEGRPTS
jgi:acyl carrier protein